MQCCYAIGTADVLAGTGRAGQGGCAIAAFCIERDQIVPGSCPLPTAVHPRPGRASASGTWHDPLHLCPVAAHEDSKMRVGGSRIWQTARDAICWKRPAKGYIWAGYTHHRALLVWPHTTPWSLSRLLYSKEEVQHPLFRVERSAVRPSEQGEPACRAATWAHVFRL